MNSQTKIDTKDIMIASLRKQLQEAIKLNTAYEQEIAVQKDEIIRLKRLINTSKKGGRI